MIRIVSATEPAGITITVDGRLAGEYIAAVDTCVKEAIGQGRPVHLFLRDVSSIDEGGRVLLGRLAAEGVRLSATGVYSSYVVSEISPASVKKDKRER
jgi:hypothetical protein